MKQRQFTQRLFRSAIAVLLVGMAACNQAGPPATTQPAGEASEQNNERRLILENASLEQADSEGQVLWKIQTKRATYSRDRRKAELEGLSGDLYQDGELVLKIVADRGEIYRDGQQIYLKKNIVAIDTRNQVVLRGQEAEWQPETDLLTLRDRPTGSHKKLQVVAKESRYNSRTQIVELVGQIVATLKSPSLQLKSEHVFWELKTDKVISDRPTQLVQFEPKTNTVSEQVTAQQVEVDLEQDTAHFQQQVNLISVKPAVEIAGSSLTWQYNNRLIVADQPVQLFHPQEQLTVTGNRGQLDLEREIATLEGGVKGLNQRNQSQLYADRLTWQIPTQILEAQGHVTYAQSDPPANLKGTKATGTLRDNRVVVYGGAERVETQIFPES